MVNSGLIIVTRRKALFRSMMSQNNSQIINFFKNQSIFITGGTGLVGKLLVEKLLRTCEIRTINLLIRPKKGKTVENRLEELLSNPCFDSIKSKKSKINVLEGDCNEPNFGLDPTRVEDLIQETSCIFHIAANVKFDQTLKEASHIVRATQTIVELAQRMPNLKALVYVSTAYSNCIYKHIKEEFYEPPMKVETFLDFVDSQNEAVLNNLTPHLLGSWPNTYVYTKSISEDIVRRANLPLAVIRPSCILNTINEPLRGYIDNTYGVIGAKFGAFMGIIRSSYAKKKNILPIVPADYVSNCALAAAWKVGQSKETVIYNCIGYLKTLGEIENMVNSFYWDFPSTKYVWYKSYAMRENKFWHETCVFFYLLLAYLFDFILFFIWKKKNLAQKYKYVNKAHGLTSHFSIREWIFDTENINSLWDEMSEADKKIFIFNEEIKDFNDYFRSCALGLRLYLIKDPIETLPQGQKKLKILFVLHSCLLIFWYSLIGLVVAYMVKLCCCG